MTQSQLFKSAHKAAKEAKAKFGGAYVVYLSFYLKKENRSLLSSGFNLNGADRAYSLREQATPRQLDYLASLVGVPSFGFSHKKWCGYFSKSDASNAIVLAKAGKKINVTI